MSSDRAGGPHKRTGKSPRHAAEATPRKRVATTRRKQVETEAAATPSAATREAFLVLGMHRSGTSLFSGMLQRLGAAWPKTLIAPNASNPKGYGESIPFMRAHDRLLASAGSNWSDWAPFNPDWIESAAAAQFEQELGSIFDAEFGDAPLVAMKDPRVCRFAGFWMQMLKNRGIRPLPVIVFRNPLEVAASLNRRDKMPMQLGLLLWLRHVLDAERATRGMPRAFVGYGHMLEDWREVIATVRAKLGVRWPRYSRTVELEIDSWIDVQLHREVESDKAALQRHDVAEWVRRIYALLLQVAKEGETQAALKVFDAVSAEFDKSSEVFGVLTRNLENIASASTAEAERLTAALAALSQRERATDAKANALWREVETCRLHAQTFGEEIAASAHKVRAADARADALDKELTATRERSRAHETRVGALIVEVSSATDRAKAAEAMVAALTQELGELVDRTRSADRASTAAAARAQAAETRVSELGGELAAADARVEGLTEALAQATETLRAAGADLKAMAADRDAQRKRADDAEIAQRSAFEALTDPDALSRQALEAELLRAEENRRHEAQLAQVLRDQVGELERALKAARERIASLSTAFEAARSSSLKPAGGGGAAHSAGKPGPEKQEPPAALIRAGMFDDKHYILQLRKRGIEASGDLVEHFLSAGAALKISPHPDFDVEWYLRGNPDVQESGENPLVHFLRHGKAEGRSPNPKIDLNSSTFNAKQPYAFASARTLNVMSERYAKERSAGKASVAFYTAITGGYDELALHEHLLSKADYHVFTDGASDARYVYRVNPVPYFDTDQVRAARFVKTHPHMLLSGYEIAIWIDGNVLIRGDLSQEIEAFRTSGLPVAAVPHPLRLTVYEEADECAKRSKDDLATMQQQVRRYHDVGFAGTGLIESNYMMFRLGHPLLPTILNTWWAEMEKGSRRDQLSIGYALNRADADYFPLTRRPNSVRNHKALALFHHGSLTRPEEAEPIISRFPGRADVPYISVKSQRIAAQRSRTADVIVCVHNALDVVQLCLQSVARNRDPSRHRIIIVNDGSGAETTEWVAAFAASHPNTKLIRHEKAGGYTKAANAGLQAMKADMAILLNSDTIASADWIDKLADALFSNPGAGIAGPMSSAASHQSLPDHRSTANQTAINDLPPGFTVDDMNRWCEENAHLHAVPRVPLVHGFCFALSKEVIAKVGYFDEAHFPHGYGEENDYCLRAVNAGFSLVVATHTYVFHKKSQSYEGDRRTALMKAGNQKIRDLHGEQRVLRAVRAMQENPELMRLRKLSLALFDTTARRG